MAVVSTLSNHFRHMLATKKIDFDNDVFKIILMNTTFDFDPATHDDLSDVTADQLDTDHGYVQDTKILANVAVVRDDVNDVVKITWDNAVWTASGGDIGPSGAAVIYDDSTTDDTVVAGIDYGEDGTAADGFTFSVTDIEIQI